VPEISHMTIQKVKPITKIVNFFDKNKNPVKSEKDAYWIHEVYFDDDGVSECKIIINLVQSSKTS